MWFWLFKLQLWNLKLCSFCRWGWKILGMTSMAENGEVWFILYAGRVTYLNVYTNNVYTHVRVFRTYDFILRTFVCEVLLNFRTINRIVYNRHCWYKIREISNLNHFIEGTKKCPRNKYRIEQAPSLQLCSGNVPCRRRSARGHSNWKDSSWPPGQWVRVWAPDHWWWWWRSRQKMFISLGKHKHYGYETHNSV